MKKAILLFVMIVGAESVIAQSQAPLTLLRTMPLAGVTGKLDHFAIDLAGQRLFVAATGNHSVQVIDFTTGKIEQNISGLGKPHGLAWDDDSRKLYVADGALAELLVYSAPRNRQLLLAGKLKLSDDADDLVLNARNHLLFVGSGGADAANPAGIAVVDINNFTVKGNIAVASHPEALEIDLKDQLIFANIADSAEVAVVDGKGKDLNATWKLAKAGHNVPLAYDAEDHLLFVACRTPAVLLALDTTTGKEVSRISAGEGADDLFYDGGSHRVYVISGAGEVDTYHASVNGALQPLVVIHTAPGAKTGLFVPSLAQLFIGVPGAADRPAEIRVYSTEVK